MAAAPPIRICTFDCYGTLIDWEGGAAAFLYDLALRHGDTHPEPGRAMRNSWETLQFELIQGPYRPYKNVLRESLHAWMDERGYAWGESEGDAFVRSMRSWQPFPETRPALMRVRHAGVRLAIISNTDHDIIEHTLRHLEVPFDAVVTAEDCRAYKPSPTVFQQALAQLGDAPDNVLHVAFGFEYDIGPAQAMGCRTGWVNRKGEQAPGPTRPDYVWRDLWGLAELIDRRP